MTVMRPRMDREHRDDRGASAVEFALVLVPLLIIVFGLMQYGWYFYAMQTGTSATSDAVRRLSVGDCQDKTELDALIVSRLASASTDPSKVTTTVTYTAATVGNPATPAPGVVGGTVVLRVQFETANFHFPFIPVPDGGAVVRTVKARVEDTSPSAGGC